MLGKDFFERFSRHTHQQELIAVEQGAVAESYSTLLDRVQDLEVRLPSGIHVVTNMPKSVEYIALLLACIKKGLSFTSLDPSIPEERLAYIVKDLGDNACVIETLSDLPSENGSASPTELAYIAYTSGSTGNPKGVKVSYAGLANTIDQQIEAFDSSQETRFLWLLSQGFDASLSDIFVTLLSGGTLVLPEESLSSLVRKGHIEALFNRNRITHSDIPPSLLKRLNPSKFTSLSTIVVGGEVAEASVLKHFAELGFNVFNVYGPTEASICSSMVRCTPSFQSASIGYPLANMQYSLLDLESGELIEEDSRSGELMISGIGLAMGYTQDSWTKQRFLSKDGQSFYRTGDRAYRKAGEYFFVGRIDRQFKHNGQLVCPEEIESALSGYEQITNASVYYSGKRIVASIEAGSAIAEQDLRDYLSTYLPAYMIPAIFEFSGELALNGNAKINHREIESNSLMKIVEERFRHHLGLESVDSAASFSDLGGDSLTLMDVILDLEDQGFQVDMDKIAENDSVQGISESLMLGNRTPERSMKEEVAHLPDGPVNRLLPNQVRGQGKGILLTGATGFLGIHLLRDLVGKGREITVLVRGRSKEEALIRLRQKAKHEGLDINFSNVRVLLGDVSTKYLGLSQEDYDYASNETDTIVHSAAVVNNLKSLGQIYDSNVKALKVLADFSLCGRQKVLHNMSSLSVLVSKKAIPDVLSEDTELNPDDSELYSGYAQSKWLGEFYLNQNRDSLEVVNYRPGLLLPKLYNVTIEKSSFIHQLITEIDNIGELPVGAEEFSFDITPVDLASEAICNSVLSGQTQNNLHITTNERITLKEIADSLGVKWIPAKHWVEKYRSETVWLYFYELHGIFPQFNLFETTRVDSFNPSQCLDMGSKHLYLRAYLSHVLGRDVK